MIKLLSMSASVCYLWVFMIYCANSVNASTWRLLLSDNWTATGCTNRPDCIQWLFDSIIQRWSRIWLSNVCKNVSKNVRACTYKGQGKNSPCAIHEIPVDTDIPRIVFQVQRETRKQGDRWEENKALTPTTRVAFLQNAQESLRTDIKKTDWECKITPKRQRTMKPQHTASAQMRKSGPSSLSLY